MDADGIADGRLGDRSHQVRPGVYRVAVDFGDHVARLQAGFIGGAPGGDVFDPDAVGRAKFLHQHRIIAAIFLESDADGATGYFSIGDELVVDADDSGGRKREADTFEAAATGINCGIDADDFTGHVDERAAGIAGVDGGVGLNETLKLVADVGAVFGADYSGGDRRVQAEGTAESENPIADLRAIGVSELGDGKFVIGFDLDDGEVGVFVESDDAAAVFRGIAIESDLDFGGLVNDVIVGEDETFFVDDYTGTQAALGVRSIVGRLREAVEEILERIAARAARPFAAFGFFDDLRGGNVYNCRTDFFRDSGKGVGKDNGIWERKQRGAGGVLVVGGLGVTGDHSAEDDADAESEGEEQGGENFATAHPKIKFPKFDTHWSSFTIAGPRQCSEGAAYLRRAGSKRRPSSIAPYRTRI